METTIIIGDLTKDSVSIVKKNYVIDNGEKHFVGNVRRAYINSEVGREMLKRDIPEPYLKSVFNVWGNSPTVNSYDDV